VDKFGTSAPGSLVMKNYGFTIDNVVMRAKQLLSSKKRFSITKTPHPEPP
jgi:transketolase